MARTYNPQPNTGQNPFNDILRQGVDEGMIPARTQGARNWYRSKAKDAASVNENSLMKSDISRFRYQVIPGRMYMFYYDPKTKQELPYYDRFPLVFPTDVYGDSFIGLNLHYLPPMYRARLMDGLYQLVNNNRYDETTRIQLSYRLLKATQGNRYFKPCVKKYLKAHVRSRFISIGANEWDIALFLQTERFEKAPATQVWAESVRKINYGRR